MTIGSSAMKEHADNVASLRVLGARTEFLSAGYKDLRELYVSRSISE